jgi:methionine sulfoxide reductase heme-binding subunit
VADYRDKRQAMTNEALWAFGRGAGITALVFLTISLALGIATRSGRRVLALPRFAVADVHRFAALAGMLLVVLHMVLLFFDPYSQLRLVDFILPFLGSYRPLWQGLGTLAFDVFVIVVITSIVRDRIGVRIFRLVHWATYALWPIALAHALGNGTDAIQMWFLLVAGCCALTVAAALVWRLRANYTEYASARTSGRA